MFHGLLRCWIQCSVAPTVDSLSSCYVCMFYCASWVDQSWHSLLVVYVACTTIPHRRADGDVPDPPDRPDDRPPLHPPAEAPPPAEQPELVIGLGSTSFDREPFVRAASCSVCGQRIPAGSYRWLAMPTPPRGRAYHFQKYLHARCPLDPRFPAVWLPGSIAFLSRLAAADVPHELGLADVFAHILLRWEASRPAPGGHGSCRPGSSGD